MATKCYAQVRGAALRVTGLDDCGTVPNPISYAVSRSVASVVIDEVVEDSSRELVRSEEGEGRLLLARPAELIRYTADIRFLKVDPGLLSLVAGVEVVHGYPNSYGFGYGPFGEGGFGGHGDVVGFDAKTRLPAKAFALEVWSRLTDQSCVDGQRQYGYTLFPYLMGGVLTGFVFENGVVSFTIRGAQTRRGAGWGIGPYDVFGPWQRLDQSVSASTHWRNIAVPYPPPPEQAGVQTFYDEIDNGTATDPHPDGGGIVDNGTATDPGIGIIDGGHA